MKYLPHPVDFSTFLIAWNGAQRMRTPNVHIKIAEWLHKKWQAGDRRLLLMAFRSCGKSSIVGAFAAWLLYRNADLRILVLAAEGLLAQRMVRNVRRIIERHPLTEHMKPQNPDQWATDRFTIRRKLELRDPSMLARGIDANITGSRADIVICDDVEVPKTCATADRRAILREKLDEIEFILAAGGTVLYAGTPHDWYTIYAEEARSDIGEVAPYLDGYERLCLPIMDDDGNSAWPERYPAEDIAHLRLRTGVNKFQSQMMLVPTNILDGRLNPALLKRYDDDLVYIPELDRLEIGGRRMVACMAFWDPAVSGKDSSVLAIVFSDEDGHLWLHRVCYLRKGSNVDSGEMQAHQVATIAQANRVTAVTIEVNGLGNLLPGLLRTELARQKVPCGVIRHHAVTNKEKRILESFETVMDAGMLHVHGTVYNTSFIREMQEWMPKRKNIRDDGLDAVAGAIALRPPVIKAAHFAGRQSWHGKGVEQAETGFEV